MKFFFTRPKRTRSQARRRSMDAKRRIIFYGNVMCTKAMHYSNFSIWTPKIRTSSYPWQLSEVDSYALSVNST